ncbi:MAG: hypothetical protein ACOYWZ_06560 [Bacillota bacterium]
MDNVEKIIKIRSYLKENIGRRFTEQTITYVDDMVRIRECELGYLNFVGIKKNKDLYLYFSEQISSTGNKADIEKSKCTKLLVQFSPVYVFDAEINTKGIAIYHFNTRSENGIVKTRWLFKTQYLIL